MIKKKSKEKYKKLRGYSQKTQFANSMVPEVENETDVEKMFHKQIIIQKHFLRWKKYLGLQIKKSPVELVRKHMHVGRAFKLLGQREHLSLQRKQVSYGGKKIRPALDCSLATLLLLYLL